MKLGKFPDPPRHIDEFIDDPFADPYARWMFLHFRLPAEFQMQVMKFIADRKLFCTFKSERHRVIGASTLGDVWLTLDFSKDHGHDKRVMVDMCSDWSPNP